jgi:hypothetical protein
VVLVQCEGTNNSAFSPGLTNVTQNVTATTDANYSPCLHVLVPPLLMTASAHSVFTRMQQCQTLMGGGPGESVLQWTNGESSTWTWISTTNVVGGNLATVLTGSISAGRYAGHSASGTFLLTPLLAGQPTDFLTACASPGGVTQIRGPFTFTIL